MSAETRRHAGQFTVQAGYDDETGLEVASVVRGDGRHLNLNFVDALLDMAELYPEAFESLTNMVFDLTDHWEAAGKA